jgi:hypothetical protein
VVTGVLTEAYADGRLTREEYDERAGVAATAKTLGELPGLINDLVPQTPVVPGRRDVEGVPTAGALHAQAVQRWESQRWQAVVGFVVPTVICWVIWVMTGLGPSGGSGGFDATFPWPLFVMIGTATRLGKVLMNRQRFIAAEERRLAKRQRHGLEPRG